jgi:predicted nuclease of predicted toxin-antitoxin system
MILALHALASIAAEPPAGKAANRPTTLPAPTPAQLATQAVLEKRLGEVLIEKVPFSMALGTIGGAAKVDLDVKWELLTAAGISKDRLITARMRGIRSSHALTVLLQDVGQKAGTNGADVRLAHYADAAGHVVVTTWLDFVTSRTTERRYDIGWLVDPAAKEADIQERVDALTKLIEETVDPVCWSRAGGPFTIAYNKGELIVATTPENHGFLDALLKQLAEVRARR